MKAMLCTDLAIAIYLSAGIPIGVLWERRRRGGTDDLRRRLYRRRTETAG